MLQQVPEFLLTQTNLTATLTCEIKDSSSNTRINWVRQPQALRANSYYEFLASWEPKRKPVYGKKVEKKLIVFGEATRSTLNFTSLNPTDSGIYFCMVIGNPQMTFGKGTQLSVVDILPTTAQPTTKTKIKKKLCKSLNPRTQKEVPCGPITLGLLVTGILVLLVSLGMAIHQHCQRRRARLRFIK
ncbi:T-cell surface glycoprotein CD8 beta chain, partial [Galemys pyrenaicus]